MLIFIFYNSDVRHAKISVHITGANTYRPSQHKDLVQNTQPYFIIHILDKISLKDDSRIPLTHKGTCASRSYISYCHYNVTIQQVHPQEKSVYTLCTLFF